MQPTPYLGPECPRGASQKALKPQNGPFQTKFGDKNPQIFFRSKSFFFDSIGLNTLKNHILDPWITA